MAPPKYGDITKKVNDLFTKGYHLDSFKLDVKTRTENGVNFNVVGEHNTETARTNGSLETKYVVPQQGLTFLEKWTTDNLLKLELTAEDKLAKGFKLVFDTSFAPNTGKKTADLRTTYVHDKAHVETNITAESGNPSVNGAVVLGHQGFLAGYSYAYSTARSALTRSNALIGFEGKDFVASLSLNAAKELGFNVYQRVNDKLESGVQLSWLGGTNDTSLALASKYQVDSQTAFGFRVNNRLFLGLSFQQVLRPGVKLTLSASFDARNLNAGGHKVGMGLEIDA